MLPICSNQVNMILIEEALKGDMKSTLKLGKSLYDESDLDTISQDLQTRLADPQSADNTQYTTICKALLQARSEETYKSAKKVFKACLDTSTQNSSIAKMLLIFIKSSLSQNDNNIAKRIKIFEEAIAESQKTNDCLFEIQVKEAFLDYLLAFCADPEILESGLQLQLSLIDDLNMMEDSNGFDVDDLTKRQLERYLQLIILFFGEPADTSSTTTLENKAKEILIAIRDNHWLTIQQRYLAKYHLASLLLRDELRSTCDIPESYYWFKDLLKKTDNDSPYFPQIKLAIAYIKEKFNSGHCTYYNFLTDVRFPLATVVNKASSLELKVKIFFKLALSYLPKNVGEANLFDLQEAEKYFNKVLEFAHPSSFLMPLVHYQLGCILIFIDFAKAADHFNQVSECKHLSTQFVNKIKFLKETASLTHTRDIKNLLPMKDKDSNKEMQMTFHGLQVVAGENAREIRDFFGKAKNSFNSLVDKDFSKKTQKTSQKFRQEVKRILLNVLNTESEDRVKDILTHILKYTLVKVDELDKILGKFHHLPFGGTGELDPDSPKKLIVKLYPKILFDHLNKVITHTEINYLTTGLFFQLSYYYVTLLKKQNFEDQIVADHRVPSYVFASLFLRVLDDLATTYKDNKKLLREIGVIIDEFFMYFCGKYSHFGANGLNKMTQEELIFSVNLLKIARHHLKCSNFQVGGATGYLAQCYEELALLLGKISKKQAANLILEAARLYHITCLKMEPQQFKIFVAEQYHAAFALEKNDYKKYTIIGKEILSFGVEFIEHHVRIRTEGKEAGILFGFFKVCVELLRFHDREKEGNDLIDCMLSHPTVVKWKNSVGEEWFDGVNFRAKLPSHKNKFDLENYPQLGERLQTAENLDWIPPFNFSFKVVGRAKKPIQNHPKNEEITYPSFESTTTASSTVEAKNAAKVLLERQERKQTLKESRVAKGLVVSKPLPPINNSNAVQETCPVKITLKPKHMEIFNRLWIPNSGGYRNDITITRKEAKKLIAGLNGEFHEDQGKGSHGKGVLSALFQSSRIVFGDDSMTLADFEGLTPPSEMVTVPKSPELKHYQIIQLREKLIKLGYTPDSVKEKNDL